MKKLLVLLAIVFCLARVQAQNIEGQIIASEYGTWRVPGYTSNAYSFTPMSCRVQGGASYFFAFAVGTPVEIVDANPSLTETVTPSAVVDTNVTCAASIAPINSHQLPFYLTSATGGLQEAINQNLTTPAANTILLNSQFYQLVGGATNAAAVIYAAQGSTALGLVDVTTVPTTWYRWNGSHYVAVNPSTTAGQLGTLVNDLVSNNPTNTAAQDLYQFVATGPSVYNPQAAVNAALANNGSVTLQPGVGRTPFVNTGNVRVADNRADVPAAARGATEYGAVCDLRSVYGTLTAASTTVTILDGYSPLFSSADIGRTLVAVGAVSGVPTAFESAIATITDSHHALLTTAAPFSQTTAHQMDLAHDDTLAIAQGMAFAGGGGTLVFPQGNCLTHTQTLGGQSPIGVGPGSLITGFPGEDVFASPDPSLTTGVNQGNAHIHDLTIDVDARIDATLPWQLINDSGTTAKAAMYRPTAQSTGIANNPVAPGWFKGPGTNNSGAYNGVASITAASAVMCVPIAETPPAIGQKVVFPYLANVFTATVSSTAGSCPGGSTARTLSTVLPSGSTNSQAEWFAGTSPQTINANVSGSGCPSSITLANSITPVPGYESNVAPFGLIQIDGEQFTYFGRTNANAGGLSSNYLTITGCAQNGTTRTAHTSGATVVPLNAYRPSYPWPVTPSLNTNDTTPSGTAGYFPGWNVGNEAFAFPVANGSNSGTGAVGAWSTGSDISTLTIATWPIDINGIGWNAVNHTGGFYFVQYPYAAHFQSIAINQLFYGVSEGVPSLENGGWAEAQPTADGGSWENLAIRAANPWNFVAGNQNTFKDLNVYSEESTTSGAALGADTCVYFTAPHNDWTGGVEEAASLAHMINLYCEPETGAHDDTMPGWEWDTYNSIITDMHMGGGIETYLGGSGQHWYAGNFNNNPNLPAINWGSGNTADFVLDLGNEPKSNTYGSSGLMNFAYNSRFSGTTAQAFSTPGGPYGALQAGNNREPIAAQTNETFNTGNLTAPYTSSAGGFIAPEEFSASTSFDPNPMTVGWTYDATSPVTSAYTACNVGNSPATSYCVSQHFNNSQISIGPGQRLVPGKYMMYLSAKDATTASNTFSLYVESTCTGMLGNYSIPITNAWPTTLAGVFSTQIDLSSANAGVCGLTLYFNGATTADQIQVGYLDFAPLPESLNAQTINTTTINLPVGPTGGTPTGCAQSPVTGINNGYTCPTKGAGAALSANQGISDTTISLASVSGFSPSGCFFVDAEYECYSAIGGSSLTGISRGAYTTAATTHNTGASAISVSLVLGSIQQSPTNVIAYGASQPVVMALNNGFPSGHSGLSVLDINAGSNELWFDIHGALNQTYASDLNVLASPLYIGALGSAPIVNSAQVVQDTGPNEMTSPLGLGAGHAGTLNVVQSPTIGAPAVLNYATGSGSNSYSYVCSGTDYDGNLINGTTTTITGVPTTFGGVNPFISVKCPWSAGIYSFQIYRTLGGPSQGLLTSVVGNPAGILDFNGAASGGSPPSSNGSNPQITVAGTGTPSMQLGPTNISTGTGSPTSTCGTAPIGSGSLWLRTDGGASTSVYSCAGTTWTSVTIP